MENLNAEAIKTALKCCDGTLAGCRECPNYNNRYRCNIEAEALALINSQEQRIKELTEERDGFENLAYTAIETQNRRSDTIEELIEENERLRAEKERITNTYYEAMCEMKNRITCKIVLSDEKLEEIKNDCLERIELDIKEIQADTVRKMQAAIIEYYSKPKYQPTKEHPIKHTQIECLFAVIDQIAKEMLEGDNEN